MDISHPHTQRLARYWLILAISALALAGLFSLPPVILRGPFFADKLPVEHIFATALVIHVDLSVMIWFLSIGGLFWSLLAPKEWEWLYRINIGLAVAGTLLLTLSPFIGESNPLKNNYIPVLQNPVFFIGLSLFACGILFQVVMSLVQWKRARDTVIGMGAYVAAVISVVAAVCFMIAYHMTPLPTDGDLQPFYEQIFWGGGHVLQYTFTALMLLAWLWLADVCTLPNPLPKGAILAIFIIHGVLVLPSPLFYLAENGYFLFTQQMRHGGGLAALVIGGALVLAACKAGKNPQSHAIKAALLLSILLFGYGGGLGFWISGANATVPAHYHGSIVAVTLSFIGLVYYLLPRLGFAEIRGKMATVQPYIYGLGQMMHITGLAWMGGYGALRKDAASSQTIDTVAGKALFFSGGSLAIIGGLLFVIVAVKALLGKKHA